jgi:hypothetical protein
MVLSHLGWAGKPGGARVSVAPGSPARDQHESSLCILVSSLKNKFLTKNNKFLYIVQVTSNDFLDDVGVSRHVFSIIVYALITGSTKEVCIIFNALN